MADDQPLPIHDKLENGDVIEIIESSGRSVFRRYQLMHRGQFRFRKLRDFTGEPKLKIDLRESES